jgi:hypothetical protein
MPPSHESVGGLEWECAFHIVLHDPQSLDGYAVVNGTGWHRYTRSLDGRAADRFFVEPSGHVVSVLCAPGLVERCARDRSLVRQLYWR